MARRQISVLLAGFVAFAAAARAEMPQARATHPPDGSGKPRPPAILWTLRPAVRNGDQFAFVAVAYSPDEKLLATGGLSPSVCVWDVATGKELFRPAGHKDFAVAVAFAPDGKLLASGGNDNLVRLWSPGTGKLSRELRGHTGCPTCLAFAPDGKSLAVGDDDKTIRVWDLESAKQVRSFTGHKESIRSVAFVLNGKAMLSCGSKESVRLWDTTTGNQLYRWEDRPAGPLASSPDGKAFACPCQDGSVALWDIATRKEIRRFSGEIAFDNLAFSPDGRLLAAAGDLGHLIVWEVSTGKPTHRWQNLGASALRCDSMTFTTDGRALTTAGIGSPLVAVWDLTGWGQKTPPTGSLAEDAWIALWTQLGTEDARQAHQAVWSLVAEPQRAVRLLQQHLKPVGGDTRQVSHWITELDDERFSVRKTAMAELEKLGEAAEDGLRQKLSDEPSAEARHRIERLLRVIPERKSRDERAVAVLEYIETPEARGLLKSLASGFAEARLTREAKAALDRMDNRHGK